MTNQQDRGAAKDPIQVVIDALYGVSNIPIQSEDSQWRQSAIDEALTALRQHQQDGGWRPIESCPENESVLIEVDWEHYGHGTLRAIKVVSEYGTRWHTTAYTCGRDLPPDLWPKKWQPLPPAPKKENNDER